MESNVRENVVFSSPKDAGQRESIAQSCVRRLGLKFPAIVDGLNNQTEQAYTGWPDRIYLIDRDGRIVYKSRPGPFGFHATELEDALKALPQ